MGRQRLVLILTAAMALTGLAAVSAGAAKTLRVTASVRETAQSARLTIRRNGTVFYNEPVRSRLCPGGCAVTDLLPRRSPLLEADLAGAGDVNVVLGLFSGGAHCCFIDQVFSYDPGTRTYRESQHDFFDAGAAIKRLDGRWVFLSANALVAEDALTDYADSGSPIQIWRFADRRFDDVTRQYPRLIAADAAAWLRAFNHHRSNGIGLIAPWAADEYMLGHAALVRDTLAADARHGRLHSALMPHAGGRSLERQLLQLLRQLGYTG